MKKIIFVAGIHGCGKSTFCSNLSKSMKIPTFSCSDLIRKSKKIEFSNKLTNDISQNQNLLKIAINNYLSHINSYILDGHFSLLDSNFNIVKIPFETFANLGITKVILLNTSIDIIYNNLKKRDNVIYSKELLTNFLHEELSYCKYVTQKLKIPLEIIDPYNS